MPTPNEYPGSDGSERRTSTPSLASRSLAFLAMRTTGPDPMRHEIVELSVVRVHPIIMFIERELTTRVRPSFPERCTPDAISASGFDPQEWDDAPDIYDVLTRFIPLAEGCVLVGHGLHASRAFLASAFRRAGLEEPQEGWPLVDTTSLAWPFLVIGALRSVSLDALCEVLGIRAESAPLSRGDAGRTMEVYRRLMAGRMPLATGGGPGFVGDEDAILAAQAARLAEGRHTYGHWRVHDGRNHAGEALLEVMDALNYCAAELVRLARPNGQVA